MWSLSFFPLLILRHQSTDTHAAAMCGYCDMSARIKFDHAQFAALFNESQARGDKQKLMQLFGAGNLHLVHAPCYDYVDEVGI
jgi:hypothetical protein